VVAGIAILPLAYFLIADWRARSEFAAMQLQMDAVTQNAIEPLGGMLLEDQSSARGNGILEAWFCGGTLCSEISNLWFVPLEEREQHTWPRSVLQQHGYELRGDAANDCSLICWGAKDGLTMFVGVNPESRIGPVPTVDVAPRQWMDVRISVYPATTAQ